jgi:aryl-alcohol dehydrogenase (NADP+)
MAQIARTDLDAYPLCLGGNVFGWTADAEQSFAVLDAYAEAGGNFVDTADTYSAWAPGNSGGESEVIIGDWLAARGNRDEVVVATKVGYMPGFLGLSAANIQAAAERSLARLRTDHIDLYYAHYDDRDTPLEETLGALDALVRSGKVRYLAASNYSAPRLAEALAVADREGFARYVALQPRYNLIDRERYPVELADLVAAEDIACLPYLGLADGFLTGKYRKDGPPVDSSRADKVAKHMHERGFAALAALDEIASAHETSVASVALAWLGAQPDVLAPIASARTTEQVTDLVESVDIKLSTAELDVLSTFSG